MYEEYRTRILMILEAPAVGVGVHGLPCAGLGRSRAAAGRRLQGSKVRTMDLLLSLFQHQLCSSISRCRAKHINIRLLQTTISVLPPKTMGDLCVQVVFWAPANIGRRLEEPMNFRIYPRLQSICMSICLVNPKDMDPVGPR